MYLPIYKYLAFMSFIEVWISSKTPNERMSHVTLWVVLALITGLASLITLTQFLADTSPPMFPLVGGATPTITASTLALWPCAALWPCTFCSDPVRGSADGKGVCTYVQNFTQCTRWPTGHAITCPDPNARIQKFIHTWQQRRPYCPN